MATYFRREVTTVTVEYVIPAAPPWGAHWDEIGKAMAAVRTEIGDGDAWFEARDDEIVIRFEKSQVAS